MSTFAREINFSVKKKKTKEEITKAEDLRQKQSAEDHRMVKGVFKNLESPNCSADISFRKYKEDPMRVYPMQDGQEYEIPIMVAKYINRSCSVPEREYAVNERGEKQLYTVIRNRRQRYQFVSTDFM